MSLRTLAWKLASPYDAYVSHVTRLEAAIERLLFLSSRAAGLEASRAGSGRLASGAAGSGERLDRFRLQLGTAASSMTDEQFEDFLAHLGGGATAQVEADHSQTLDRLSHTQRGLEEYFAIAGHELLTLERRGYSPTRPDIARQLRENQLAATDLAGYRHVLHELGVTAGGRAARPA